LGLSCDALRLRLGELFGGELASAKIALNGGGIRFGLFSILCMVSPLTTVHPIEAIPNSTNSLTTEAQDERIISIASSPVFLARAVAAPPNNTAHVPFAAVITVGEKQRVTPSHIINQVLSKNN
jgi:hypothetical protein